jgi:hypothetical protein
MLHSLLRSPKVRQVGQIALHLGVASDAIQGPDKAFVESITKTATGDWTIVLKEKAKLPLHVSGLVSATEGAILHVGLVGLDSVQIKAFDDAGSAMDADFNIQIQYFDQLSYFF